MHKENETLMLDKISNKFKQALKVTPERVALVNAKIKEICEPLNIEGTRLSKDALAVSILKKIPFFSGFLQTVNSSGSSISKLATVHGHGLQAAQTFQAGFQISGFILSVIDFIRIPLIYLAARWSGLDSTLSLSKGARWIYSASALALTLTALFLPATATPIAIFSSMLGLAVGVFTLGKHFYERHKIKTEHAQTLLKIIDLERDFEQFKTKVSLIEADLKQNVTIESLVDKEESLIKLETERNALKATLQILYNQKLRLEQKRDAKFGWGSLRDKIVGLSLASFGLVGLGLTFFLPTLGLSLLAAGALCSVVYTVAKWTLPWFKRKMETVINSFSNKENSQIQALDKSKEPLETIINPALTTSKQEHSSVFTTMEKLYGPYATEVLQEQIEGSRWSEQFELHLVSVVETRDLKRIVEFFKEMVLYAQLHKPSIDDIQGFSEHEKLGPALALLKEAVNSLNLNAEELMALQAYVPLTTVFLATGIDLQQAIDKSHNTKPVEELALKTVDEEEESEGEGEKEHLLNH